MTEDNPQTRAIVPVRTSQEIDFYEGRLAAFLSQPEQVYDNYHIQLRADEVEILTGVLRRAEQEGRITLPLKLKGVPWMKMFDDRALNEDLADRYLYLRKVPEFARRFRPTRATRMFRLPEGFEGVNFGNFIVKCDEHQQALDFFRKYGANPPQGLYLWGEYGNGKTRMMVSFAHELLAQLIMESEQRLSSFAEGAITTYEELWVNDLAMTKPDVYNLSFDQKVSLDERLDGDDGQRLEQVFPDQFAAAKTRYPHQPTEIAFATFSDLFDERGNTDLINDFIGRRIVIIDDIHHEDQLDKIRFIQTLVQSRYERLNQGPTFFTSNLPMDQLLNSDKVDYSPSVAGRVYSRLEQMCLPIHITAPSERPRIAAVARAQIEKDLGIKTQKDPEEN